jgi:hypothetical protein
MREAVMPLSRGVRESITAIFARLALILLGSAFGDRFEGAFSRAG